MMDDQSHLNDPNASEIRIRNPEEFVRGYLHGLYIRALNDAHRHLTLALRGEHVEGCECMLCALLSEHGIEVGTPTPSAFADALAELQEKEGPGTPDTDSGA